MPSHDENIDLSQIESFFAEQTRWATLSVTIQEIADDNETLIRDLSSYDPDITVPFLAGLLTLPKYQSHCIRLEILVTLAIVFCKGRKRPNVRQAIRWFFQIGKSRCVAGEDPAEDVFVSLVHDETGNSRLIEGVWEAAGFYTQRVLEVVSTMPDDGRFGQLKRSFCAVLSISDIICEKSELQRYQLGADELHSALLSRNLPGRNALISRATITLRELEARGIKLADIEPFVLHTQMKNELAAQQFGFGHLDFRPLIVHSDTHLTVALPTALSAAARNFAIASIVESHLTNAFDRALAKNYADLFFDTPLLGGPLRAPVIWRKAGPHRWSTFVFEVDKGYFISYHLFLTSVATHTDGGFKTVYEEEGVLTSALQSSINDTLQQFSSRPEFKEGLIVLVGCGWGKGYSTEVIQLDHPKWRLQDISAADLVRLSWLADMSPSYLWRILDGLEVTTNAGVHIVNPNGILNLIGWVRSNNGHFVPHSQLLEDKISPEQPLMLNPPLNLLRDVRADSDCGYDRHRAVDNTDAWCEVQRVSPNPFFSRESAERIYASIDHVRNQTLTSVYEGALQLWITIKAPSVADKEIEYRLWEMANEWLHRIGSVLDARFGNQKQKPNLKVYVEFRDHGQPSPGEQKPVVGDLIPLCLVEEHEEPSACKAIFEAGFLSGFRIAENVAERLFVRNLVGAFLRLLDTSDIDRVVQEIIGQVVQNKEARSFHFFHAQQFIDYVRDTLPETLVDIDPVDEAAVKIGLGWRVLDRGLGNKIEGRKACTDFLSKVVDLLLADIIELLSSFERPSTLKRLVANCEKASADEDHWKRTSAAILGLHGDQEGTIERYVQQASKLAGAGIASRVLAEIALCVCPQEGGVELADIELSKLIARAALLIRIGGLSDAIHYNALPPEITISSLGDILFRDDFGQFVVQPTLFRAMGDKMVAQAPMQKKNYDDPQFVPETRTKIDDEFWHIWKEEMGFDVDEARSIVSAIEDRAIKEHVAILEIKQSDYSSTVCSDSVDESAAQRFLSQFSLETRPQWATPPNGFLTRDIYPWRFGRRLSFVARPILKVDESSDPLLIIAPAALRKGFAYVFSGAYHGSLEQSFFDTHAMKNTWWGKASEGHHFTAKVAQRLTDAGWNTQSNIGLPELLNRKLSRDFGDVDVLAWRPDREKILVIECKDLSPARNYSEIAQLLSKYQGVEVDGDSDLLKRHLTRVHLLEENSDRITKFTGIQKPEITSCLVCSGVVPMQYAKIEALADTHVGSIEDIVAF